MVVIVAIDHMYHRIQILDQRFVRAILTAYFYTRDKIQNCLFNRPRWGKSLSFLYSLKDVYYNEKPFVNQGGEGTP